MSIELKEIPELVKTLRKVAFECNLDLTTINADELLHDLEESVRLYPLLKEIEERESHNNNH